MQNATMLYKCPGPHDIHGGKFDHTTVDETEIEEALADGWHLTTTDAKAAHEASTRPDSDAPATRDELKQKADQMGLVYAPNVPTAKLAEMIDVALAAKG